MKYACNVCGWVFDEQKGYPNENIDPNTPWSTVSNEFHCPLCYAQKSLFREVKTTLS